MSSRPRRMPNFTPSEENVLRMLSAKYRDAIEEKGSNAVIWGRKNRAWHKIEEEFFDKTKVRRTAAKLKSKYEMMKKYKKLHIVGDVKLESSEKVVATAQKLTEATKTTAAPSTPPAALVASKAPKIAKPIPRAVSVAAPEVVIDLLKEEPNLTPQPSPPTLADKSTEEATLNSETAPKTVSSNAENQVIDMSCDLNASNAHAIFYRNKEIREREKHLAELTNLEIRRKILEMELKIKEREFNINNMCTK